MNSPQGGNNDVEDRVAQILSAFGGMLREWRTNDAKISQQQASDVLELSLARYKQYERVDLKALGKEGFPIGLFLRFVTASGGSPDEAFEILTKRARLQTEHTPSPSKDKIVEFLFLASDKSVDEFSETLSSLTPQQATSAASRALTILGLLMKMTERKRLVKELEIRQALLDDKLVADDKLGEFKDEMLSLLKATIQ